MIKERQFRPRKQFKFRIKMALSAGAYFTRERGRSFYHLPTRYLAAGTRASLRAIPRRGRDLGLANGAHPVILACF